MGFFPFECEERRNLQELKMKPSWKLQILQFLYCHLRRFPKVPAGSSPRSPNVFNKKCHVFLYAANNPTGLCLGEILVFKYPITTNQQVSVLLSVWLSPPATTHNLNLPSSRSLIPPKEQKKRTTTRISVRGFKRLSLKQICDIQLLYICFVNHCYFLTLSFEYFKMLHWSFLL